MNENIAMSKTSNITTPKKQRALVLGGGGIPRRLRGWCASGIT